VVFDRRGPPAEGRPRLVAILAATEKEETLLRLAASAQLGSEHPLAKALVVAARERGLPLTPPDAFRGVPGKGASATVAGRPLLIGSPRFIAERGIDVAAIEARTAALAEEGLSLVYVAEISSPQRGEGKLLGAFVLRDGVLPAAPA